MRILIIDNNIDRNWWGAKNLVESAQLRSGTTISVRRGPCDDLPPDPRRFDRIVISGSKTSCLTEAPWVENHDQFLRRAMDARVPILGVCYGHQSLVRILTNRKNLRKAAKGEIGWTAIRNLGGLLLNGLPKEFHSFSSHYEEVIEIPPGAKLIAASERCGVQGFELSEQRIFGIQFHPEKSLADGERTFVEAPRSKDIFLERTQGKRLYDPKVNETIFTNFLNL